MKNILIVLITCVVVFSCRQEPSKEELLAGKEYKYWIDASENVEGPRKIAYFDRKHIRLGYYYYDKKKHFFMEKLQDALYNPSWKFENDSIINIGGEKCKILKLTETEFSFVSDPPYRFNRHYKVAPKEIIPKEYQKYQEVPDALKPYINCYD